MAKKIILLGLIAILFPLSAIPKVKIIGTILGWNDKPIQIAHCHIRKIGDEKTIYTQATDENGNFSLNIPWDGYVELYFTGVFHQRDSVLIYIPKDYKEFKVKVRLSPNVWVPGSKPKIFGNFEGSNFRNGLEMKETNDGKFYIEIKKSKEALKYELGGIVPQRNVNGTQSDYFEYDGDGDYFSVISTTDTIVKIFFDPSELPSNKVDFEFHADDIFIDKFANLYNNLKTFRIDFISKRDSLLKKENSNESLKKLIQEGLNNITNLLKQRRDFQEKELLLIDYLAFSFNAYSNNFKELLNLNQIQKVYQIVSPLSPLWFDWATEPGLMLGGLLLLGNTDSTTYVDSAIAYHPSIIVRQKLLKDAVDLFLGMNFNKNKGLFYYEQLQKNFPNSFQAKITKEKYQKNLDSLYAYWTQNLRNYSFFDPTLFDTIRVNSLIGQKYIIFDFWATWCTPCILTMKALNNLPPELKNKIFIISIALDEKEKAYNYIKQKQKNNQLKWYHSIEPQNFKSSIAKLFNITGIPFMVILNKEGKIVFAGEIAYFLLEEKLKELLKF